ncbi:hypothetical protein, partial [Winogradskyella sp.]
RLGWITSVASLLVYPIALILVLRERISEGIELLEDRGDYIITGIIIFLLIVLVFILSLRPVRDFYSIKIRDWAISGTIVILFTLDKLIIT